MRRLVVGMVWSLERGVVGSRLEHPSYRILAIVEALLNVAWGHNHRGGHEAMTDENRRQDAEWCDWVEGLKSTQNFDFLGPSLHQMCLQLEIDTRRSHQFTALNNFTSGFLSRCQMVQLCMVALVLIPHSASEKHLPFTRATFSHDHRCKKLNTLAFDGFFSWGDPL